jgi:hypothetical protein
MNVSRWLVPGGFFLTTSFLLWVIYSLATSGAVLTGRPAVWICALLTSLVLTVLLARRRTRRAD